VRKADNLPPSCAVVTKSGYLNLNFLEPSGPVTGLLCFIYLFIFFFFTVPQKEIPALLENWITHSPSVELFYLQKNLFNLMFSLIHNMLMCLCIKDVQRFAVSCKTLCRWVTTVAVSFTFT